MRRNTMRSRSESEAKTTEISVAQKVLDQLATAETARTASHIIIAGNAMLSSSVSPLVSSSLNSIFSSVATAITYGRTPQKIQQARLEDLKMLIESIRPLFSTEIKTFFAESDSYQKLKKQFETLQEKYSAALESKPKTFQYLILAIGFIGSLYFAARLVQDNDELNWTETIAVLGMIGMMSYSNVHSHRDLVMCSRKDYQEFIEALIQFNTHVIDEVPVLKVITTLEQTKKEMEKCEEELRELGVEMPEICEAEVTKEGGVEESKGAEKSLMERVEERLQNLMKGKEQEAKKIKETGVAQIRKTQEGSTIIEQAIREEIQKAHRRYQQDLVQILKVLERLENLQVKHNAAVEKVQKFCEELTQSRPTINSSGIHRLKERFSEDESLAGEEAALPTTGIGFGIQV